LKKKSDEKEKANQAYENQEQMFVTTLGVNEHTTYDWIIDYGATQHMTFEGEWFTIYESIVLQKVYMGDDTILEAIGKGSIKATMQVGGKMLFTTITQVLHVPKMKNSFISVSKLILEGLKMEFDKDGCKVNNVHGTIMVKAHREKDLYLLNVNVRKENANVTPVAKFVSIRCILTLAAIENMEIHQMDIKTTFLNGINPKDSHMMTNILYASFTNLVWVETISKGLEPKVRRFLEKHQVYEE
jgi:hypothetical protein